MRRISRGVIELFATVTLSLAPMGGGLAAPPPGPIEYVTVDDGTEIAVRVYYPEGFEQARRYPALFELQGYGGAASPSDGSFIGSRDYIVVTASIRGTGCSGGQLDLFSERASRDGAWIIDNWIPIQPWSDGKVGIFGHSYGGITGFLVAAEVPDTTHLKAVAVSGLVDDWYRGIFHMGGIANPGFPADWMARVRPAAEYQANADWIANDPRCRRNFLEHRGPALHNFADVYGERYATPGSWMVRNSLLPHGPAISAPIQIGQLYQDEQTGPRGANTLWEAISADVPRRLVLSTGRHSPSDPTNSRRDWLDCWVRHGGSPSATTRSGGSCADVLDPQRRVLAHFESRGPIWLPPYASRDWPLPETDWRRYHLCADGSLTEEPGASCDGAISYVSTGTGRHLTGDVGLGVAGAPLAPAGYATGLPDTLRYELPLPRTTTLAGPINLTLHAAVTTVDVDLWAEILDKAPDGSTSFVQRGLLRASFRRLDEARSPRTPSGDIYRPEHPFLTAESLEPGIAYEYQIEIFPFGHVWRAGHTLVLQVHAPAPNDPISEYAYEPNHAGIVTVLQDAQHRSSILVPVLPDLDPRHMRPTAPNCGSVNGEICVSPG